MNKVYTRIDWENYPSINTPINESNLNKMDAALDEVDNRAISLDTSKATKTEVATLVADVRFDESTGVFTVQKKNGVTYTIDTKLEKITTNWTFDKDKQQIILTLDDGTKQYIDLSALITQYEFLNSDTITFVVQADGKIKAEIPDGSITESKLQPNYLAQIKVETAKSESYMNSASQSATSANNSANLSKSYAVGGTGTRENEDTDNAMYYYEQAKQTDIGQISSKVDELNSNLDSLEFGEVAGGKNLWNIEEKTYTNSITDAENHRFQAYLKLNGKLAKQKTIMENGRHELRFGIANKGLNNLTLIHSGIRTDIFFVSSDFNSDAGDYVLSFNVDGWDAAVVGGIRFNNIQLEKGTTATDYEPYIPSVKMLADEVNQQKNDLDGLPTFNNIDSVSVASNGSLSITVNGSTYTFYPDVATG